MSGFRCQVSGQEVCFPDTRHLTPDTLNIHDIFATHLAPRPASLGVADLDPLDQQVAASHVALGRDDVFARCQADDGPPALGSRHSTAAVFRRDTVREQSANS